MDKRLELLWAENEIRKLPLRYALAVDTRDWALMESLWVDTPEPVAGETMLDIHRARTFPQAFENSGSSQMFVSNHLIEVESATRACGTVYCHCTLDWGYFFEQRLVYLDTYECHDGKWLFLHRDHLLWWGREWKDNPMRQAPAHWPQSQLGAGVALDMIRTDTAR